MLHSRRKPKTLPPVRPSVGLEVFYRQRLDNLIQQMHRSVMYWVAAAYKANEPAVLAQDELPATALKRATRKMARRWQSRFNEAAPELAKYFATSAEKRSKTRLHKILKDGGFSVQMTMTRGASDVLHATIAANVNLIKSIPQKYLDDVQGAVMRSVQTGRDLKSLTDELTSAYGVTRRRAAFIARDQNNKATASMVRGRQAELGITEAIWVHSGGGKVPRPSHVKAGREKQRYDVKTGWYDPHEKKYIFPGELISCRCVSRAVVPGFS